jgi:transketolase
MAIAERFLAAHFNRPNHEIVNHHIYGIVSDGDLMEGVSHEAASLAGHLKLGNIIYFYDDNHISIDGSTELAFTENRVDRFKIGYGSPNKQDTASAHGEPLGAEEIKLTKENLGWPLEPPFLIPEEALKHFRQALEKGKAWEEEWTDQFKDYEKAHPELAKECRRWMSGQLPEGWDKGLPSFPADPKGVATRVTSGTVLTAVAPTLPNLIGGSADLAPSNKTFVKGEEVFQGGQYAGRNFHFGVREHGMGSILNGMALHGGVIPYGGTFLIFSDYMRPPIRLASMSWPPSGPSRI